MSTFFRDKFKNNETKQVGQLFLFEDWNGKRTAPDLYIGIFLKDYKERKKYCLQVPVAKYKIVYRLFYYYMQNTAVDIQCLIDAGGNEYKFAIDNDNWDFYKEENI